MRAKTVFTQALRPAADEAVSALTEALYDSHEWVRDAAQEALDKINEDKGVSP